MTTRWIAVGIAAVALGGIPACGLVGQRQIRDYEVWKQGAMLEVQAGRMPLSSFAGEASLRAREISMAPNYSRHEANRMAQAQLVALDAEAGRITVAEAAARIQEITAQANAAYAADRARADAQFDQAMQSMQATGFALMEAGKPAPAYYPTNCTTTYVGNVATTNCY